MFIQVFLKFQLLPSSKDVTSSLIGLSSLEEKIPLPSCSIFDFGQMTSISFVAAWSTGQKGPAN